MSGLEDIHAQLADVNSIRERASDWLFALLREIGRSGGDPDERSDLRDTAIRLCAVGQFLTESQLELLNEVLGLLGLYPYVEPERLGIRDLLTFEAHRPLGVGGPNIVFHGVQSDIYRMLMEGENIVLSAPTSFGKSLIIDALIASGRYRNVVVVVPTIALIDEARRRLSRFAATHRVITHSSQEAAERNIFVFTQERVIDYEGFPEIDLFVIDEFYKLSDASDESDRADILNHAFYRLYKTGAQFYMLGPGISNLSDRLPRSFYENARFVVTDFTTVALDVTNAPDSGDRESDLIDLCRGLDDQTLIYCSSPRSARNVVRLLAGHGIGMSNEKLSAATDWVGRHYHPEWAVVAGLAQGIGLHHGSIPRALAHFMVRAFNDRRLRFLVCTSTLIEGVNTSAKNVVIYDHLKGQRKFDYFTFNNIQGRSGRMFQHFVGNVFLFHQPPEEELPDVDIPVLSQPEDVSPSLLLHVEESDLTEQSKERLKTLEQDHLSWAVLRSNTGVSIEGQLSAAMAIGAMTADDAIQLAWNTPHPSSDQLHAVCKLLFENLLLGQKSAAVRSTNQLYYRVKELRDGGTAKTLIDSQLANPYNKDKSVDEIVDEVLAFLRNWATFKIPRYLSALDSIQREVLSRRGLPAGDYSAFAVNVENLFMPAALAALEEYGLPAQVAMKIKAALPVEQGLDALLAALRYLKLDSYLSDAFELEIAADVQEGL